MPEFGYRFKQVLEGFEIPDEMIKPEYSLRDDLARTNSEIAEIISKVENIYGFRIPEKKLPRLDTIGSIASCIEELSQRSVYDD